MQIDVLTLFPEMFEGPFAWSIVKRAKQNGVVKINIHNLRDYASGSYKAVDDRPYGGGPGMIIRVDIIDKAICSVRLPDQKSLVVLTEARGKKYSQNMAKVFSKVDQLIIICGHYEGIDARVSEYLVDETVSVGDYILSGGEIPAMAITDSVVRLLPGALGNEESLIEESFNTESTEYPQYTRPEEYKGWRVPEVLLGGNHKLIDEWRKSKSG